MSSRKRLSQDQLLSNLVQGPFGQSRDLPPSDPIAPMPMLLDIDEIVPYDRNPRRESNERYDDIRESVKARGIDAPLRITRRPGDAKYMIAAGGNTRLAVIKDLADETGEPQFRTVHCLFTPWKTESDVLAGHLVENELRADLVLIDKALALRELKTLLDEEAGAPLTQRGFNRHLHAMGYRVSLRQLRRYDYAVERLLPLIPLALRSGMGVRQIDQIQDIQKAYQAVHRGLPGAGTSLQPFEPLWEDVLARHDASNLDVSAIRKTLDGIFSEQSGVPLNTLRLTVDAALYDIPKGGDDDEWTETPRIQTQVVPVQPPATEPPPSSPPASVPPEPVPVPSQSLPRPAEQAAAPPRSAPPEDAPSAPETLTDRPPQPQETPQLREDGGVAARSPVPASDSTAFIDDALNGKRNTLPRLDDLKSWRARCAVLAQRFANHFGLSTLIKPVGEGLGFFVDAPGEPPTEELTWSGWWLLFSLSEQGLSPARVELLPPSMALTAILAEGQTALYDRASKPPPTPMLSWYLLSSPKLTDPAFRDMLLLIESCRTVKANFRESDLWACPTIEQTLQSLSLSK